AYASLTAANVTVGRSLDLGKTFQFNPVGNAAAGVPINDRQWMGFFDDHTVYLEYRNFAQGIAFAQQSTDGGLTYGPATLVGTLYGTYSDGANLYLIHSLDHGAHWSPPVRVNNPADTNLKLNVFPWLAAGPTPGSVGIMWYGTDSTTNNDNARWRVYYAQTFNATSDVPSFQYVRASDHTNHAANISLSGLVLTGGPNRNLLDYFQVNFDPVGAAEIAYTDDHNDFSGEVFATRQIGGPSINAKLPNGPAKVPAPKEGSALPAQPFAVPGATPSTQGQPAPQPMQPGPNGEQVTDFGQDQDS